MIKECRDGMQGMAQGDLTKIILNGALIALYSIPLRGQQPFKIGENTSIWPRAGKATAQIVPMTQLSDFNVLEEENKGVGINTRAKGRTSWGGWGSKRPD